MDFKSNIMCYHLKGSSGGAVCGLINMQINSVEGGDVRLCMSRHYEACWRYHNSLRSEACCAEMSGTETAASAAMEN